MTLCKVIDLSQLSIMNIIIPFENIMAIFFKNHSPFLSRLYITKQMLTEAEGNIDYINPLETKKLLSACCRQYFAPREVKYM